MIRRMLRHLYPKFSLFPCFNLLKHFLNLFPLQLYPASGGVDADDYIATGVEGKEGATAIVDDVYTLAVHTKNVEAFDQCNKKTLPWTIFLTVILRFIPHFSSDFSDIFH